MDAVSPLIKRPENIASTGFDKKEELTTFKCGNLFLKTSIESKTMIKVFLKIVHSDFDVQLQVYSDPKETVMYGFMRQLKCDFQPHGSCSKTFSITKKGSEMSGTQQCITFVAKDAVDASDWVEALSYRPTYMTPSCSPCVTRKQRTI